MSHQPSAAAPPRGAARHDVPDTHEMVVVHRVFRSIFGELPGLARGVADGDRSRAGVVVGHYTEIATALHHHHTSEDELLWPKLLERMPQDTALVIRMEEQHERVAELIERADALAATFGASGARAEGETFATTVGGLTVGCWSTCTTRRR